VARAAHPRAPLRQGGQKVKLRAALPIHSASVRLHRSVRLLGLDPLLLADAIEAGLRALLRFDLRLLEKVGEPGAGILAIGFLVRYLRAVRTISPLAVIRLPASAFSRWNTAGGSRSANTSNRSCTAVATLLTFWPPGPEAAMKLS